MVTPKEALGPPLKITKRDIVAVLRQRPNLGDPEELYAAMVRVRPDASWNDWLEALDQRAVSADEREVPQCSGLDDCTCLPCMGAG